MSKLPWSPRPTSSDPPPWSPSAELEVERLDRSDFGTVMWDPDNVDARIFATEASWVTGPDYDG